jgi:hypothetical protein
MVAARNKKIWQWYRSSWKGIQMKFRRTETSVYYAKQRWPSVRHKWFHIDLFFPVLLYIVQSALSQSEERIHQ